MLTRPARIGLLRMWFGGVVILALLVTVSTAAHGLAADQQPGDVPSAEASAEHAQDHGDDHAGGHTDPFSFILLQLAVVVIVAMLGRWLAGRWNQPAVLGELLIGVALGNIGYWLGRPFFIMVMHLSEAGQLFSEVWHRGVSVGDAAREVFSETQLAAGGVGAELLEIMTGTHGANFILMAIGLWMFSSLGIILLLFMVGLESSVGEMLKVGPRASAVAVLGIIVPFGLGYLVSVWMNPDLATPVHLFLGATLCATSVGITARVFKDLGALQRQEAKVILGAAVIDDVLGLIILAVVVGIVATGQVHGGEIARISLLSLVFFGVVVLVGERVTKSAVRVVNILDRNHSKLLFPLALAFFLSWLANQIELATIVGAFAAGLIINEKHFDEISQTASVEALIAPLEKLFAPIFFVLMGMQVNLASFAQPGTMWMAAAFTGAAIIGKAVAGLPAGKQSSRLTVGLGMIPRGEVGLIFASIGKGLGVVNDAVFSAVVVMVMVTTLVTPPALKWSLSKQPTTQED